MSTSSTTSDSGAQRATNLWLLTLIALSVVMGFQAVRVFVTTLVYAFGERFGQTLAAVPALIVFISPFVVPLIARRLRPHIMLAITVGGMAVARLLMQVLRSVDLVMILSGVMLILGLLALAVIFSLASKTTDRHQRHIAQGIFLGLTLDAALNGAFLTWDYIWQPGIVPLITGLIVSGLALFALMKSLPEVRDQQVAEPGFRAVLSLAALGPFFAIQILFLQNVAFVASSALIPMEIALGIILIGNAIAFGVLGRIAQQALPIRLVGGAVLVVIAALMPTSSGVLVIALVLIGQAIAAGLLESSLSGLTVKNTQPTLWRTSVAVGIGCLLFVVLVILYYISTLITLPFSYTILPLVGAIVILLAAFAPSSIRSAPDWKLGVLPLALLAISALILITKPAIVSDTAGSDSFRMVDYNIHQAVSAEGWVDPEAIAQVIEAQKPAIVALQEVSRGWLIAGSLDVAEWLSRRLKMPYVYAPGHDYQFGNIILSRMPIKEWSWERLPLQNVPLGRGLIRASIDIGGGKVLTVINTHLSAYAATDDRIPQVQKVLDNWNKAPRTLIVGDMNAHAGEADMQMFASAGFQSAQDVTNNATLLTFSSTKPIERIDWIYGTPDIQFSEFAIPTTTASDHLPLAVSVAVR